MSRLSLSNKRLSFSTDLTSEKTKRLSFSTDLTLEKNKRGRRLSTIKSVDLTDVKQLIAINPDFRNIKIGDKNLLHYAVIKNNVTALETLIDELNPNDIDQLGATPLHYACADNDKIDIVCLLLLFKKKDIFCKRNEKDNYGMTPLLVAVKNNCVDVVEVLSRDNNVNFNAKSSLGFSALHFACINKNAEIVKMLLNCKNIIATSKDNSGKTALMHTLDWKIYDDSIKLIWNYFFEYAINDCNYNVLNIELFKKVIQLRNIYFLERLLKYLDDDSAKILFNKTDQNGYKPIHYAIELKIKEIIKFFIKNGATITHTIYVQNKKKKIKFSKEWCKEIYLNFNDYDLLHILYNTHSDDIEHKNI